jgi:hypothetical protein
MWKMVAATLAALAIAATVVQAQQAQQAQPPLLTEASFARWKQYLQPSAQEQRWQEISWHPVFWEGVQHARAQDKPILLWVMNGHPLGCT